MNAFELSFNEKITNRDKFGAYVKNRREKLGISLRDLALQLNVSPAYISDIERGNRPAPYAYLEQIIDILKVDQSEIEFFYDIANCTHTNWPEINQYLSDKPNARKALRLAMQNNISQEDLYNFITKLSENQFLEEEIQK